MVANDIWEERDAFPDLRECLSYSLAACAHGMRCADELLPNKIWRDTADSMLEVLLDGNKNGLVRTFGDVINMSEKPTVFHTVAERHSANTGIDASLMGLLYPFEIYSADDSIMLEALDRIEAVLGNGRGGIFRYESDRYDGCTDYYGGLAKFPILRGFAPPRGRDKGAGAWPLLSLWMSICRSAAGDEENRERALWYMDWVIKNAADGLIPEQVFPEGSPQVGVSPLCWAHAMFVTASYTLGLV